MANGNGLDDQQRPGVGAPSPNTGLPTPGVNNPNRRRNGAPGIRPNGAAPGVGRSDSQRFLPTPQAGAGVAIPGARPRPRSGPGQATTGFGEDRDRRRRNSNAADLNQNVPPSATLFGARTSAEAAVSATGGQNRRFIEFDKGRLNTQFKQRARNTIANR